MGAVKNENLIKKLRLNDAGFTFFSLSVFLGSLPVALYICSVLSFVFIAVYYLFAVFAFLCMIVLSVGLIFTTENPMAIFTWIDGQSVLDVIAMMIPYSAYVSFSGAVAAAIGLACYSFGPKGGKPIFKMVWCVVEIIFLTALGIVSINGGGAI